jgi:hypothetical protein
MTNLDIIDDIMVIYLNSSNEHNKIFSTNQTAVKVNCKLKAHCYTARRPSQPSWARARVSSSLLSISYRSNHAFYPLHPFPQLSITSTTNIEPTSRLHVAAFTHNGFDRPVCYRTVFDCQVACFHTTR